MWGSKKEGAKRKASHSTQHNAFQADYRADVNGRKINMTLEELEMNIYQTSGGEQSH